MAAAATGAYAQAPSQLAPLSSAVFDDESALPSEWRGAEIGRKFSPKLKISLGGTMREPSGQPSLRPSEEAEFEAETYDVRMVKDWPDAVRLDAGDRNIAVTPHAGLGFSEAGPGAEAGAELSFEDKVAGKLGDFGVRDGKSFGDKGRWYLFAATSGRSVGLNVTRDANGELHRAGWSQDGASALVSDAQVGVGWRKGPMQASIGYQHRKIKPKEHGVRDVETMEDGMVAISFSFKPR
ncbi:MAG TPA: hypothetical protein VD906_14650 [Caulobacteraceae bacterium]|nr:hypothetical protein [Caulobacteraceae bacterium]